MGKKLIIKGADFYENAVRNEQILVRTITPIFTNGNGISSANGEFVKTPNQKYCKVNLKTGDISVIIRATGYKPFGIAFFNNNNVYIDGIGFDDFNIHNVSIPQGATKFKYSYLADSRATELGKPILSTIYIKYVE